MKKVLTIFLILLVTIMLSSCKQEMHKIDGELVDHEIDRNKLIQFDSETDSKIYKWEKDGFGGDFTITLYGDGTYEYYEGYLSSYIGYGTWEENIGYLTLIADEKPGFFVLNESGEYTSNDEEVSPELFHFYISGDELIFLANDSSEFLYTKVESGDKFILMENN